MPVFIDTHAHIFMKHFAGDREETVARAKQAGVAAIIDVGLDIETNRAVLDFSAQHPEVFPIIGFHPHEAVKFDTDALEKQIKENAGRVVALGEFGLDFFKDYAPRDAQKKVFEQAIGIVARAKKPIILHCREAGAAMMPMLRDADISAGGVMHCFSGDVDFLKQTLSLGLHISVGGPVTYPNAAKLERVVAACPRDRLLLETDCPYLTPQKFRGKRNEPAYIPLIAERIAQIWKIAPEEVGEITTSNALSLFKIELPS